MILLCLAAVVIGVLLALPPPPARRIPDRLDSAARPRTTGRRVWVRIGGVALFISFTAGAALLAGPPGAVTAASAGVAVATAARLFVLHRARRRAAQRRLEVARGCAAIASQVRVGRVPGEALASAADDWPVLAAAHQAQLLGAEVPETLLVHAERPGCAGLAELARAWRLATDTGAPMAGALENVATSLRRDEALQRMVAAELAGPRATAKVMAVLPLCGIGMGYLLGGRPVAFLLEDPLGWGCLIGGVVLACAGVFWVDQLARVAEAA